MDMSRVEAIITKQEWLTMTEEERTVVILEFKKLRIKLRLEEGDKDE